MTRDLAYVRTERVVGSAQEVDTLLRSAARSGLLVHAQHRRLPDGRTEVWLRLRSDTPPPTRPRRRLPRWLTPGRALLGAGVVLVVAGCAWGAARATTGAGRWAEGNLGLLVPLGMVAVAVAGLWLTRRRTPQVRGGHTCPGASLHCPSCRGH